MIIIFLILVTLFLGLGWFSMILGCFSLLLVTDEMQDIVKLER